MGQFSMWTRTSLLLSVALCAGRCAESPDATGPADATATDDVDGGVIPVPDSGTDVDALAQVDAEVDGQATDTAVDGSGDGGDAEDVTPDAAGELGTPCRVDVECASGDCVDLAGGDVAGLCSDICGRDEDCPDGFDCVLVTTSGADAERRCLPTDYCADGDEDGFGVGPGCSGVDCNDDDAAVNLGVDEVCDGVDNDCDETVDENSADVGDDCSTGFEGVCAPGRTQCVDGGVQCVAFVSPADEVCDGLDNDCDGSADEDVLLEGYRLVDGLCEPVSCGAVPAAPANATLVSVSSTQFGGEVVYACAPGYGTAGSSLVDGRVTRVCGASGSWESAIGSCTPVDCGSAPAASANARLVSVDRTTLGGTAAYACNEGYGVSSSASGRYEVVCEASGVWSASGTCDPVSCGALTPPANGNVSTPGGVEYTDVATYSCNSGYVLTSGSSSRICDLTGAWTGSAAMCTPLSCGGLSNPSNGSVSLPDGSFFGATARYRCDAGYRLAGPDTRSCLETGAWSGVATLCEPVSCGPLVNPDNGAVATTDGTEYTDVGVYSCNSGYVLASGSSSRICDASGSWSGSAAVCTPVDCGALSDPDNGDVAVAGGTTLGATASYTCLDGYALSGSATRTCGVTGAWSGSAPSCAPTSCGAVATVANATASVPSALLGSTATFTCDVGFVQRAGTSTTQTCTGSAWVWSGTVLSCDPVSCGPLGNPDNGTVATLDGNAYADVATYACNSGFTLTGSPTRTCQLSGVWSGAAPGCAPVDCGAPPSTTNGTRTFPSTIYTSVASYACAEGYTLTGSATSTCTATGTWTTAPSCVAVSCGALGSPANGSVSTPTGFEYADVATYGCAEGYLVDGAATRTCLATGLWSGAAPGCAPVDCGTLGSPANGIVSTPGGVTFGATATYSCNSGYVLSSGSSSRICGASGSWSGSAAVCTPVDCGTPPTVTNGTRTFTTTTTGSTASYNCNSGYTRSGSATLTCDATGSWGTAPTCADANECVPAGSVCTASNNVCTNTAGSWQCSCAAGSTGMTMTGGDASCTVIPSLGLPCTVDAQCPANSWCPTDTTQRYCSPRPMLPGGVTIPFQYIPAGTFIMGSPESELGHEAVESQVSVTLTNSYYVSRTEVTQAQWNAATGGVNPSCFQSPSGTSCSTLNANNSGPVERVDWFSVTQYANWLSFREGLTQCYQLSCTEPGDGWYDGYFRGCGNPTYIGNSCNGYRLLSEAEWEYAARAGTVTATYLGDLSSALYNCTTAQAALDPIAWWCRNAGGRPKTVSGKLPNVWGLYDMLGNVREWVTDAYVSELPGGTDPVTSPFSEMRGFTLRGGAWAGFAVESRAASRLLTCYGCRSEYDGFRLARTVP